MKDIFKTPFSDIKYYHEEGNNKPRILLIHGFNSSMGFAINLIYNKVRRIEKKYLITAIDLPGFGSSTTRHELTLGFLGQEIWRFIDAMNLKNFYVVAHSMGADIALRLNQNSQVKGTLLIAPFNYETLNYARIKDITSRLHPNTFKESITSLKELVFNTKNGLYEKSLDKKAQNFLEYVKAKEQIFNKILSNSILSKKYQTNVLKILYECSNNVEIISGDKDILVSIESLRNISKKLNMPLTIVKNVGHSFIFEASNVVDEAILRLIAKYK